MIAVIRIAVPDAESQLKRKTAGSAVSFKTTGGTRVTSLSRPAIGMLGAEMRFRNAFICGVPQANTVTVRTIHGAIANLVESGASVGVASGASIVARERAVNRRYTARQSIEIAAEIT